MSPRLRIKQSFLSLAILACLLLARSAAAGHLDIPAAVDTNPDPNIYETTLVAMETSLDVDGDGSMETLNGFNGLVPGPEIRVKVGDTIIVHFINELDEASSIHWHGIELNNRSDGTPVTQNEVMPGGTFLYHFIVPRSGVFWYHPHFKPGNQVFKGLYAPLIVTDDSDDQLTSLGVLPGAEQTKTLVLGDVTVCKAPGQNDAATFPADLTLPWSGPGVFPGNINFPVPRELCENPRDNKGDPLISGPLAPGAVPNVEASPDCRVTGARACRTTEGQWVLANGRLPAPRGGSPDNPADLPLGVETLEVVPGQGLRLRIVNAAIMRYFRLRMTDAKGQQIMLFRVGGEGGLLDRARVEGGVQGLLDTKFDRGEVVLGPSDRTDVVLVVPRVPRSAAVGDTLTLWTSDYSRTGRGFSDIPTVPVLHLKLSNNANQGYSIGEGVPLLADPRINRPVEDLKSLTIVDHLLDPNLLMEPRAGSGNEEIKLTTFGNGVTGPSIDGVIGTFDAGAPDFTMIPHLASSRFARIGDLLELKVTNTTAAHHPFHLHGFSFQPVRVEKQGVTQVTFDFNEFVDTFDIPGEHTLVFRVRLDDRPLMDGITPGGGEGRWVFHCHIFHHAALGMISELVVLNNDRDFDGISDDEDPDDDNDGLTDAFEIANGLNPVESGDALQDADGDTFSNLVEAQAQSNPNNAGSLPPGAPAQPPLVASVLPTSRSVQVGGLATAFATMINATDENATDCSLVPVPALEADYFYRTTDPATNAVVGELNTPVNIPGGGGAQTFLFGITPSGILAPQELEMRFDCSNKGPAARLTGVNTLLFSASQTPVLDVIALVATLTGDGIVAIDGATGASAFSIATANVGAGDLMGVSADTGSNTTLPLEITLCETDPVLGTCRPAGTVPAKSATLQMDANATPTFAVFVQGTGNVPFDPATNRIFVRFKDRQGFTRGATSVAVRTQ